MKKQKSQLLFVFLGLLLIGFTLGSCEAEKNFQKERKMIVKRCSMKEANLQEDGKLQKAVSRLKTIKANSLQSYANAKMVYDETSGLFYDDEKGIYVSKDGKESYTFPIIQLNPNEKIKNITFNKNAGGGYDVYIVCYGYTKDDVSIYSKETLAQYQVEYIPLIKEDVVYTEKRWLICVDYYEWLPIDQGELTGNFGYTWVWISSECESGGTVGPDYEHISTNGTSNGSGPGGLGGPSGGSDGTTNGSNTGGTSTNTNNNSNENTSSADIVTAAVIDDGNPIPPKFPCLTPAKLLEIFPNASLATRNNLANNIRVYGGYFGIDTKEKLQHFLAQIGAETDGLINFTGEDLDYSTPSYLVKNWPSKFSFTDPTKANPNNYLHNPEALANLAYCCGKNGNGDEVSGDGWLFRGRGFMQLTGRANYEGYHDYLTSIGLGWLYVDPDSLNLPNSINSILSAMWYFKHRVLDKMDIDENTTADQVTRWINRRTDEQSKAKRRNYFEKTKTKINC